MTPEPDIDPTGDEFMAKVMAGIALGLLGLLISGCFGCANIDRVLWRVLQ